MWVSYRTVAHPYLSPPDRGTKRVLILRWQPIWKRHKSSVSSHSLNSCGTCDSKNWGHMCTPALLPKHQQVLRRRRASRPYHPHLRLHTRTSDCTSDANCHKGEGRRSLQMECLWQLSVLIRVLQEETWLFEEEVCLLINCTGFIKGLLSMELNVFFRKIRLTPPHPAISCYSDLDRCPVIATHFYWFRLDSYGLPRARTQNLLQHRGYLFTCNGQKAQEPFADEDWTQLGSTGLINLNSQPYLRPIDTHL